jgi:hypothetical protein
MPYGSSNPGETLLRGVQAGQGIRAGYEDNKSRQATKKFFEKLRSLETPDTGGIPVPDAGGSESSAAVLGASTGVIPTDGGAIQPSAKRRYRSFTQDDMDELNQLAASAATAGGDPKVYEALRGTARSYMQSKVLDQFRKAQTALQVGDEEGLEDALRAAYQYVPDGKDLKLKRNKDGQLMFRHPVHDQDMPVNAEMLGLFARGAMDPMAFEETIYQRKKDAASAKAAERGLDIQDKTAGAAVTNAATNAAEAAETARANREKEKQAAANAPSERNARNAAALRDLAYAGFLNRGKDDAKKDGSAMNAQREYAKAVNQVARDYIMPTEKRMTQDPDFPGMEKVIDAPAARLPGFENAGEGEVNIVSSYAEQIGIANPELGISQAVGAGAAIYRALQGGGNVHVDPKSGLLGVPVEGRMRTFRVPQALIASLMEQAKQPGIPSQP